MTSLEEFAKNIPTRRPKGWFDRLPDKVKDELKVGRDNGVSTTTMIKWLTKQGHKGCTDNKLNRQLASYVHSKDK